MGADVRKPTAKPTAIVTVRPMAPRAVSATTRPETIARRGTGSDRSRSNRPSDRSSAAPMDGGHAREEHARAHEAGDEEVDVADPADGDGAAEHVAEDEQEHGALDHAEHEDLRGPDVAQHGAPGDAQRWWSGRRPSRSDGAGRSAARRPATVGVVVVIGASPRARAAALMRPSCGACGRTAAASGSASGSASAVRPVSFRNTSSRVARRRPMSVTATPRESRIRTASSSWAEPSATGMATDRVGTSTRGGSVPSGARAATTRSRSAGSMTWTWIDVDPAERLELVGRALGDDLAVVDDGDVGGQLVGLVEVLGGEQHVGARRHQVADDVPQLVAAAGVEAGGGLVEQEQLGGADQAGAEVELAAHAAGVGAHQPVGGVGEAQPLEHDLGAGLGLPGSWPNRRPTSSRFSRPVMAALDRGRLAGQADRPADLGRLAPGRRCRPR